MWKSIRGKRRCIVVAEGFYEWLKKGNDRVPHHVKRKDGKLMLFAGLWDTVTCVFEASVKSLLTITRAAMKGKRNPYGHIRSLRPIAINS